MPNPDHVFEIFGTFSHETAEKEHERVLDFIICDTISFNERMAVVFTMLNLNLDQRLKQMSNSKILADEIAFYRLCQLYLRQVLIDTTGSVSSTLKIPCQLSLDEFSKML